MYRFSAARLNEFRIRAGLTLTQLAYKADLSYAACHSYESGHRIPQLGNLFALATALGVDPRDLVEETELEAVDR